MFRLKTLTILGSKAELSTLPEGKLLINTINAHSYNTALKDPLCRGPVVWRRTHPRRSEHRESLPMDRSEVAAS